MTKQFRSEVFGAIEDWRAANFPSMQGFYENGPPPNLDDISPMWLDVSIRWHSSRLITTGVRPAGRQSGVILTKVYFRAGEGVAEPDEAVDSLKELLRAKRLGGGLFAMPHRTVPTEFEGWYSAGLMSPFTLDD